MFSERGCKNFNGDKRSNPTVSRKKRPSSEERLKRKKGIGFIIEKNNPKIIKRMKERRQEKRESVANQRKHTR